MKLVTTILLAVLLMLSLAGKSGQAAPAPGLPLNTAGSTWRPLSRLHDAGFQAQLEEALKRHPFWQSLIGTEKLAVGLVDLSVPAAPRFAQVNGETMMYGASLPKLAILLAAFQSFEDGNLKETPAIDADLKQMIRRSDNAAAGRMAALIGLKKIETLLLSPRYRFYDPAKGGGIWLGSGYTAGGDWHPDPIKGLTHTATVYQLCRFYYLLAYGRLINPQRSRQMLSILSSPELHDKFVQVLEPEVPLGSLHRKSGEYKVWFSDSILVWAAPSWRRYILVAMVENGKGEKVLEGLVPVVERLLQTRPHLAVGLDRGKQAPK
jgi:beta-lactamase class A